VEIEEVMIDFPCPECQQEFQVGVHQLLEGGVIICPNCQATNVETELVTIARELEELGESIRNLKKCLDKRFRLKF